MGTVIKQLTYPITDPRNCVAFFSTPRLDAVTTRNLSTSTVTKRWLIPAVLGLVSLASPPVATSHRLCIRTSKHLTGYRVMATAW